jgi:homogentisate 1,2-dioxygenase
MPQYLRHGLTPQKRYTYLRRPDGRQYYEHIITADGFQGAASLLYRLHSPARMTGVQPVAATGGRAKPVEGLVLNMLCKVGDLPPAGGDFVSARQPIYVSDDIVFSIAKPDRQMQGFYRNAAADELVVVIQGSGVFQSVYGDIAYDELDVLFVPRGDTVRWLPDAGPQVLAVIESRSPLNVPADFLKANGQFHEHSPYHERDLRTPSFREPIDEEGDFPVLIKSGDDFAQLQMDRHPFDVVGWDGYLYPFALNLRDYEPRGGRISLLPDQYALFSNASTLITCITPRRLPDHPEACNLQPFHQNIDFDEILYRFSGSTGLTEPAGGTVTLHPRGFGHGPKPGFENLAPRTYQEAWGLMLDTKAVLRPTAAALAGSDSNYVRRSIENQLPASETA